MWTGVAFLMMSALMILINFAGYLGNKHENRNMLIMYASCLTFGVLLLTFAAIACFMYATVPEFVGIGDEALAPTFPDSNKRHQAEELIKSFNLIGKVWS
jgi:hypothetical protein